MAAEGGALLCVSVKPNEQWLDCFLPPHQKHMQRIMTQCFLAVKSKLECRLGFFDLFGCDFMVDEDFKVGVEVLVNVQTGVTAQHVS